MCHGTTLATWQARCLEQLMALDGVEPRLLIIDADHQLPGTGKRRLGRLGDLRLLAWRLYGRLVDYPTAVSSKPVDLGHRLDHLPTVHCHMTRPDPYSEYFSDADVASIREHRLDFILRFAFGVVRGDILETARYGVWSFHHGDMDAYRGGPPCFWEIYNGEPVTGAVLQRLTERLDGGVPLYRGYFRTDPESYVRNRDAVHMASADWPARVCRPEWNRNKRDHKRVFLESHAIPLHQMPLRFREQQRPLPRRA